jgi:hemerythrin
VLEWRSDFSIGNEAVDNDHQHLISRINQIYAALAETADSLSIETMLEELQVDISEHFALEELLMHQAGFGEYEHHKKDHESLLDQINDMIFHFSEDPQAGRELLLSQLSDWFARHFTTFDARLHNQLGA